MMQTGIQRSPATGRIIMKKPTMAWCEDVICGDNARGWCLACGNEQDHVEPDAHEYVCESCEMPYVYGASELLIMDRVR